MSDRSMAGFENGHITRRLVLIRHYGWRAEAAFGKFKSDGKEACFSAGTISCWTTYLPPSATVHHTETALV